MIPISKYAVGALFAFVVGSAVAQTTPYPILFATAYPIKHDFTTAAAAFGNHLASIASAGRGGDLYIRYPDGTLRNLTREAGYGIAGANQDGPNAIAVRDPAMHWSGTKAVFAMVRGAPVEQFHESTTYWQLYEVTGLGRNDTAVITRVAGQPANYNNVQPAYATDDSLIFGSDRPFNGASHLYPQFDEYEGHPINTGLWRLQPGGELTLLTHAPSGAFDPFTDRAGRVVFTNWDHLQRDQQNGDGTGGNPNGSFNYASEAPGAAATTSREEVFPEPRFGGAGDGINDLVFNHFFPWQINEDGTDSEVLNHLGRHELTKSFTRSFTSGGLSDFSPGPGSNPNRLGNGGGVGGMLQISEDPRAGQAGCYVATNAPEFRTHGAGQLVRFCAPIGRNPEDIDIEYLTYSHFDNTPQTAPTGMYRDPIVLDDGRILASRAATNEITDNGTPGEPDTRYDFRLRILGARPDGFLEPTANGALTGALGIVRQLSFWSPDNRIAFNGTMWEMGAVEVRARPIPSPTVETLKAPEQGIFTALGVDIEAFRTYLRARNLGVLVVRNATTRDRLDRQQPFNLRVANSTVQTIGSGAQPSEIAHFQFLQGDLIRGQGGANSPDAGRRPLAQFLHDPAALAENAPNPGGPAGSVAIHAADGSVAAFVPARRALTWQSTTSDGTPVVRERFWLTVQPGEVRACDGCHGVNTANQAGQPAATNPPEALRDLLQRWVIANPTDVLFKHGFEN
jgi:hypothetical protein